MYPIGSCLRVQTPLRPVGVIVLALLLMVAGDALEAGVAVSPLKQQIVVKPGRDAEFAISVAHVRRRSDAQPIVVKVEVVDFSVSLGGGLSFEAGLNHARSAAQWVTLDAHELVLEPGKGRKIRGRILAPFAADGDYWAAILVTIRGPKRQKGVNIVLRTASAIFVRVARRNYVGRFSIEDMRVAIPQFEAEGAPPSEAHQQSLRAMEDARALKVSTDVANKGIVGFIASGTAFIYDDGARRVATIPLHAHRRRILPGHTRRFVGLLPAPLPTGNYIMRVIFSTDSKCGRKALKETTFMVGDELAQRWQEYRSGGPLTEGHTAVKVVPGVLECSVAPGRFTTAAFSVINQGAGTMRIAHELAADTLPRGWLQVGPDGLTLARHMRRSIVCRISVPQNAKPGSYTGELLIRAEGASLGSQPSVELRKIPVRIRVEK